MVKVMKSVIFVEHLNYNIYMDGVLIDSSETQELTVEVLQMEPNTVFKLLPIMRRENQSRHRCLRDTSGPFQIGPLNLNFRISARIL